MFIFDGDSGSWAAPTEAQQCVKQLNKIMKIIAVSTAISQVRFLAREWERNRSAIVVGKDDGEDNFK